MNCFAAKSGLRMKVGFLLVKATPVSRTATLAPAPWAAPRCFRVSQAASALTPPWASKACGVGDWPHSEPQGRKFHWVRRQSPAAEKSPRSFGTAEAWAM